eukprot:6454556-Prymnesium_polylepis.1
MRHRANETTERERPAPRLPQVAEFAGPHVSPPCALGTGQAARCRRNTHSGAVYDRSNMISQQAGIPTVYPHSRISVKYRAHPATCANASTCPSVCSTAAWPPDCTPRLALWAVHACPPPEATRSSPVRVLTAYTPA